MPNMSLKKNEMPVQDPQVRNKNFKEVALGYTKEQAIDEAQRCLHCKTRNCVAGCPVRIDIPDFIKEVAEGNFEEAYQFILANRIKVYNILHGSWQIEIQEFERKNK